MKIRAAKCEIRLVNNKIERDFLNENHYQGYIPSKVCYGLYNNNELLCLMSFGTPRYNKRYDWELLRLCTKKDYQVYGGASKLFKYFCNNYSGSIISYCNMSKFTGKVYESIGMNLLGTCKSYHYEKDGISYHRSNFMKKKLVAKFPEWSNLTEQEIMCNKLGFIRIDEEQATFVYGVKWYIYQITNNINGKTYIGQHLDRGDDYWGSGTIIKRSIAKYGIDNFTKEILQDNITSQKEADKLEMKFINDAKAIGKAEYNILTVPGPHVSSRAAGHKRAPNKSFLEYAFKKGNVPWNVGLHYKTVPATDERKRKASESNKKLWTEEKRQEMSNKMLGNKNARAYSEWKCVETGEIKSRKDWLSLGYRCDKIFTKGRHFVNCRKGE